MASSSLTNFYRYLTSNNGLNYEAKKRVGYDGPNLDISSLGLNDNELFSILKNDYGIKKELDYFYPSKIESFIQDLIQLQSLEGLKPDDLDVSSIYQDAENQVQQSIDNVNALYDKDLQTQTQLYNKQMSNLNDMYNQNASSILSNDYRNNASLMGSVNSSLSKARQSALEAGASAGLRLASNVNTLLSVQNKQAQASLDTSNQLAQSMLNQRQAAMNLQNNYSNILSENTNRRAALENEKYERVQSAKSTAYDLANNEYQNKLSNYEDNLAKLQDKNALVSAWSANNDLQNAIRKKNSSNINTSTGTSSTNNAGF